MQNNLLYWDLPIFDNLTFLYQLYLIIRDPCDNYIFEDWSPIFICIELLHDSLNFISEKYQMSVARNSVHFEIWSELISWSLKGRNLPMISTVVQSWHTTIIVSPKVWSCTLTWFVESMLQLRDYFIKKSH